MLSPKEKILLHPGRSKWIEFFLVVLGSKFSLFVAVVAMA